MKKNIDAVNEVLFNTLEQLQKDEIKIEKAKAIVETSNAIAKNMSLQLNAFKTTRGQIKAPVGLSSGPVYATKGNGDTHAQKTEYAKSLGYAGVVDAVGALGSRKFNTMYKEQFNAE